MRGAHGARSIAPGDKVGEIRAEAREVRLELADENGMQVIASGGASNAPDLGDQVPIEQQGRFHLSLSPRASGCASRIPQVLRW
jgi:hypothetical protein